MNKRKMLYFFLAFSIPCFIFSLGIIFKTDSFLELFISDLGAQYLYFFDYFKDVLSGNQSLIYSFSNGIGHSMIATFAYYLGCPLNLFLLFVSKEYISIFIVILITLKIGLSGLTMYIYLHKKKEQNIPNLIFSISYALMTFTMIYYFNIMWLDILYLGPIILLGLDQILKNKKSKLYSIFLFIAFISNYYMAFNFCIFLIIYFLFRICLNYSIKKDKEVIKQICIKFFIQSLLTGLLACILFIPVLNELSMLKRTNTGNMDVIKNIVGLFFNFGYNNHHNYAYPYIFPGFFAFSILLVFIAQKNKQKKTILITFFILILCILIPKLNYIFHGFSYPILFTNRFAYIVPLFLIIIASEVYDKIEFKDTKKIELNVLIYIFLLISCNLILHTRYDKNIDSFGIVLNIIFLITYIIILYFKCNHKKEHLMLFLILCFIECFINLNFNLAIDPSKDRKINSRHQLLEEIETLENNYYRVGGKIYIGHNEIFGGKVSRIQNFNSNNNEYSMKFFKNMGFQVTSSFVEDNASQNVINTLLGVHYWYNENNKYFIEHKNILNDEVIILKNPSDISIGYMIDNKDEKIKDNVFENQNAFARVINKNSKPLFYACDVEKIDNYHYEISNCPYNDKYVYTRIDNKSVFSYFQDHDHKTGFNENGLKCIQGILEFDPAQKIQSEVIVYGLNKKNYNELIDSIKEQIVIDSVYKNELKGHITVYSSKDTLLMTIPYDTNFDIYVDGKKVKYEKIFDTFIGIPLEKGTHTIYMVYHLKTFKFGFIISIIGLLGFIWYFKSKK